MRSPHPLRPPARLSWLRRRRPLARGVLELHPLTS
uniref:CenH3 n=1 Tax=Arundo donax TaxID=35708 RepID=A0A0A9AYD3_ARUDO